VVVAFFAVVVFLGWLVAALTVVGFASELRRL
jgi:hypothetical protein